MALENGTITVDVPQCNYVSDYLTPHRIRNEWDDVNDHSKEKRPIIINGQMAMGKTTWVMKTLCPYYITKVLMVVPRIPLRNSVEYDKIVNGADNLDIMSYQEINNALYDKDKWFEMQTTLEKYCCIVCDEFHYWIQDSHFTPLTEFSYNAIMQLKKTAQIVLMSATPQDILTYMKRQGETYIEYVFGKEYNVARGIRFIQKRKIIDGLIRESAENNIKTVIFCHRARDAFEIYQAYPDKCHFITSTPKYSRYVDKTAKDSIARHHSFNKPLLVTTTTMEVGVTIKDSDVKRIIIDVFEPISAVQCIGRVRAVDDTYKVDVYIFDQNGRNINGYEHYAKENFARLKRFGTTEESKREYIAQCRTDYNYTAGGMIVPTANADGFDWFTNGHCVHYHRCLLSKIEKMKETSYADVLLKYLKPSRNIPVQYTYGHEFWSNRLYKELNEQGYRDYITPEDKERLINLIDYRKDGRQKKQFKLLRQLLKDSHCGLTLSTFYHSRKYQNAWRLSKW